MDRLAPVTILPGYEPEATRMTRDADVCLGRKTYGYDVVLGGRVCRDPIGEDGGLNLYVYVGNNPIIRIDSLGLYFGALPVIGTIEQGVNTWRGTVNGMKASDYKANNDLGHDACEADINNQAFWKTVNSVLPNPYRLGIEAGATIGGLFAGGLPGVVIGIASVADASAGIAIGVAGMGKIRAAATEAKKKCCKDN